MSADRKWIEFSGRIFDGGESTVYPELTGDVYLWSVNDSEGTSSTEGATFKLPSGSDNYSCSLRELFDKHGYLAEWDYSKDTGLLKRVMKNIKSNYLVREDLDGELEFMLKDGKQWHAFSGRVFSGRHETKRPVIPGDVYIWKNDGEADWQAGAAFLYDDNGNYHYTHALRRIFIDNGFEAGQEFNDNPQLAEEIGCLLQEEYEFTLEGDIRRIDPDTGNVPFEDLPEIVDIEELGMF